MNDLTKEDIESKEDFEKTPRGWFEYWSAEIKASKDMLKDWHKQGDKIVSRYTDSNKKNKNADLFKLNLFHSNVKTQYCMLYGNLPKVDVSRRFADAQDDVGRVASEMIERGLNIEMSENGTDYDVVFRNCLLDRLTAGLGTARCRYEVDTTTDGDMETVTDERAPVDYVYWQDMLWSWCRTYGDMRWQAFRNYLTKDEVYSRFGKEVAEKLVYKEQNSKSSDSGQDEDNQETAWKKAEIWEIWSKEDGKVYWYHQDYKEILEVKDDPLQLKSFFPSPPSFIANATSTLYIPTPDFQLCQDLYNSIDILQTRIKILTEAVKAVGVYDSSAEGVKRIFSEGVDNTLIPVENWAIFGEKGGLQGAIQFVPIGDIVNALDKLTQKRDEEIALLQQISGMSDVMRGGLSNQYEGVGQSQIKAKFGSVRMQALQDEFAVFCSELMQIKAEIICKHFSPERIVKMSNMQNSVDQELILPALELIKNYDEFKMRVVIRPESVAMVDYASLREERSGFMNAISTFMQSASPLIESDPSAKPFLLKLLQWAISGFKGSQEIEGVMDKAIENSIEQMKQAQEAPQQDPAQIQAQMEQQREQMKLQNELQKIQAKAQSDMQVREHDKVNDIETAQAQHAMDVEKIQAESIARTNEIKVKAQADIQTEVVKSQANIQQSTSGTQAEVQKESAKANIEVDKEYKKAQIEMEKQAREASIDVAKEVSKQNGKTDV